jgi:hypothetical protein
MCRVAARRGILVCAEVGGFQECRRVATAAQVHLRRCGMERDRRTTLSNQGRDHGAA